MNQRQGGGDVGAAVFTAGARLAFAPFWAPFNRLSLPYAPVSRVYAALFWAVISFVMYGVAFENPNRFVAALIATVPVLLLGLTIRNAYMNRVGVSGSLAVAAKDITRRFGYVVWTVFIIGPIYFGLSKNWTGFFEWSASSTFLLYLLCVAALPLMGSRAHMQEVRSAWAKEAANRAALRAAFGLNDADLDEGATYYSAQDSYKFTGVAGSKVLAKLGSNPGAVDRALDELFGGRYAAEHSGGVAHLRPTTPEQAARRELVRESQGLIEEISEPDEQGVRSVALVAGISPAKSDAVSEFLARRGLTLTRWEPATQLAQAEELSEITIKVRDRVANLLKVRPWEIGIAVTENGDRIDQVRVSRAPTLSIEQDKREASWLQLVQALPGGSNGWTYAEAFNGDVTLTWGAPRELPASVRLADLLPEKLDPENWHTLPLGLDEASQVAAFDLTLGPHCLNVGPTGSGKTVALLTLMAGALARGHQIGIIDPTKGGVDFAALEPYTYGFARTYEAAVDLSKATHKEGERRREVLLREGQVKWSDLPDNVRDAENIHPITLVIDEVGSLLLEPKIPNSLPKGSPERVELEELASQKAMLGLYIGRIARELRFVGVHLELALQRPDASILSGELRSNLTSTLQLAKPGSPLSLDAIRMVFPGDAAAEAYDTLRQLDDGSSRGLGVVAGDGGHVAGVRVAFAGMWDIPPMLDALGVPKGSPLPTMTDSPALEAAPAAKIPAPAAAAAQFADLFDE